MFRKNRIVGRWADQKISVLMPAYNSEKTIGIAARSALRAINSSSELLVYLDSCTDNTERVLREISDSRLRILVGTEQLGPGLAMTILCDNAKYEMLGRLDADDIALPWRFWFQARAMNRHESDFEFTNIISFGSDLKFGFRYNFLRKKLSPGMSQRAMLESNPFVHSTALMRASAVKELGGYRKTPAEDYDLWLRAAISGYKVCRSRVVSVLYRIHASQISRSKDWLFALAHDYTLNNLKIELQRKLDTEK